VVLVAVACARPAPPASPAATPSLRLPRTVVPDHHAMTKKVDPLFGIMNVIASLGNACDAGAAAELRTFFHAHKAEGAERTLQQAIESIESCAALEQAQSSELDSALAQL
jgi:hypothetical protein